MRIGTFSGMQPTWGRVWQGKFVDMCLSEPNTLTPHFPRDAGAAI